MATIRMFITIACMVLAFATRAEQSCDFSASCSGITYDGSTLFAACGTTSGGQVETSINLNSCVGNNNGQLDCSSGYFQSCAGIEYSGTSMSATCTKVDGSTSISSEDLNNCVSNSNGNLQCC